MVCNRRLLVWIAATTVTFASAKSQDSKPAVPVTKLQVLEAFLEGERVARGFPGASAAVVLADGTSICAAVGFVDAEGQQALTPEHRIFSGSIGKTYVAAVTLQLVAAEQIELDGKVAGYLPDAEWFTGLPNSGDLTVRMLLGHTAGLPDHVWDPKFARTVLEHPDKVWTPAELLASLDGVDPLFPAGSKFAYSDSNYVLLGAVLEQVTGKAWFELLRARLLDPLGLKETTPSDRRDIPNLANGFGSGQVFHAGETVVDGRFIVNPQFEYCGGGVCSTPRDLARWCRLLSGGDVIPESMREAQRVGLTRSRSA